MQLQPRMDRIAARQAYVRPPRHDRLGSDSTLADHSRDLPARSLRCSGRSRSPRTVSVTCVTKECAGSGRKGGCRIVVYLCMALACRGASECNLGVHVHVESRGQRTRLRAVACGGARCSPAVAHIWRPGSLAGASTSRLLPSLQMRSRCNCFATPCTPAAAASGRAAGGDRGRPQPVEQPQWPQTGN